MEKRRKIAAVGNVEEGGGDSDFQFVDVEDYEVKKVSYRHRWGYLLALAILGVFIMFKIFPDWKITLKIDQSPGNAPNVGVIPIKHVDPIKLASEEEEQILNNPIGKLPLSGQSNVAFKHDAKIAPPPPPPSGGGVVVDEDGASILQAEVDALIKKIRHMKKVEHKVIEADPDAKAAVSELQDKLRVLLKKQYGEEPYRIEMKLQFPKTMAQPGLPQEQSLFFTLGPMELVPYSIYNFLEIVKHFKKGAFHRRAGHVLQSLVRTHNNMQPLAFQEYNPKFPHKQYTMGYAGRPGGPEFYISTVDNVANHGPASQGSHSEADSCFAIVDPHSIQTVQRMKQQPGAKKPLGFVGNPENHIKVLSLKLLGH